MKIFVTGAAGYIGGSVAEKLMASGHELTGLARSGEQAEVLAARGIKPVVGTLDDAEILAKAALDADGVVNAASADHPASVVTLVTALERSGKFLVHTTGSAIVADGADGAAPTRAPLSEDDHFEPLPFRRPRVDMNRYIRQAAIEKGVRAVVICPTMIYGAGRGAQPHSDQVPKLMALSKQIGAGVYFGEGLNRYSNVHIDDLADLYLLAIEKAPGGSFFFAENGSESFKAIAASISEALGLGGATVSLPIAEVIRQYGEAGRLGVGANSLVSAVNARRLGWAPKAPSLADWIKSLKSS